MKLNEWKKKSRSYSKIGCLLALCLLSLHSTEMKAQMDEGLPWSIALMKGIAVSATPNNFEKNPMMELLNLNTEWVAVVPYAHAFSGQTNIKYNVDPNQWWGETPEGIRKTIKLAHEAGMKVMLKPQIYMPDGWVGHLNFDTEREWRAWEKNFESYTLFMLKIAAEMDVELFCMATEFKESTRWRSHFWQQLIKKCRSEYSGMLTFSANWDYYEEIPFWHLLDFIGVSAYFPLLPDKTPSITELKNAWKPIKERLRELSKYHNKPILFTEFGYLSVDGGAHKSWLLEKKVNQLTINEQTQYNAIDALYQTFWEEGYWKGGFLWKWFPNGQGHTGYPEKDYCPRGKKAEAMVAKWFSKN